MNASTYQEQAARTLLDAPGFDIPAQEIMLLWNAIGLAGEAGEVAEHIKKGVLHQHGVDANKLGKELGDVLWYVAGLCTKAGLDMSQVMAENIQKLQARYPHGFTAADSQRRVDVQQEQPAPAAAPTWPDPMASLRTRLDDAVAANVKLKAELDLVKADFVVYRVLLTGAYIKAAFEDAWAKGIDPDPGQFFDPYFRALLTNALVSGAFVEEDCSTDAINRVAKKLGVEGFSV